LVKSVLDVVLWAKTNQFENKFNHKCYAKNFIVLMQLVRCMFCYGVPSHREEYSVADNEQEDDEVEKRVRHGVIERDETAVFLGVFSRSILHLHFEFKTECCFTLHYQGFFQNTGLANRNLLVF
jgi:hypothetical protein